MEYFIRMVKALLPIAKRWAKKTQTEWDDALVEAIEHLLNNPSDAKDMLRAVK